MNRRPQTERSSAVHAAGHAVIARVLGLVGCGSATIAHTEAEGEVGHAMLGDPWETIEKWERDYSEELARTGIEPVRYRGVNLRSAIRARIMTSMAGTEAENELIGVSQGSDAFDRREIEQYAEMEDAELPEDLWQRYEPRMRRHTRRLIRKHREKIERLAAALQDKKTLPGEEIDRLIAKA
jgi:hypothetical protein